VLVAVSDPPARLASTLHVEALRQSVQSDLEVDQVNHVPAGNRTLRTPRQASSAARYFAKGAQDGDLLEEGFALASANRESRVASPQ
jgi:hypothetical protein